MLLALLSTRTVDCSVDTAQRRLLLGAMARSRRRASKYFMIMWMCARRRGQATGESGKGDLQRHRLTWGGPSRGGRANLGSLEEFILRFSAIESASTRVC